MGRAPAYRESRVLMNRDHLRRTLACMAREILKGHPGMEGAVLVGVRARGVPLAERLARAIHKAAGVTPPVGSLDITLYRDDLTTIAPHPILKGTEIPFPLEGRTVILVDDVLYTGRTVRAALDELIDFGRPARIELAVLVDRGHRELPIHADYVGATQATTRDEIVQVRVQEEDGEDRVLLMRKAPTPARGERRRAVGTRGRRKRGRRG